VCIRCVLTLQKMCVESRVFYPTISQRSCHVQHSKYNQNVAIHSMFNMKRVSSCFFTIILYCKQVYFTWEKCIECAYGVFLHCTECALSSGCFIQRYRSDPAMYSTLPAAIMQADTLFSIYKSFKMLFQHYIVL